MKKLVLSILISFNVFGCEFPATKIMPYDALHKDAVIEIAFEDLFKFFCGSEVVRMGFMSEEAFIAENKKGMEAILADPLHVTKVLMVGEEVAAFVEFSKMREPSIESILKMMKTYGAPACDEQQLAMAMPHIKKTDAECQEYGLIGCLAVSKEWRGKGYGKALLIDAQKDIKQRWPALNQVRLTVNESNDIARKLYEAQGFVPCSNQLAQLSMMKVIEYQKSL